MSGDAGDLRRARVHRLLRAQRRAFADGNAERALTIRKQTLRLVRATS